MAIPPLSPSPATPFPPSSLQVGLVDEVGGLGRALEVAREAAGLSPDPAATITAEWPTS